MSVTPNTIWNPIHDLDCREGCGGSQTRPVTHEGCQAVRREAGAPKLRGVGHAGGEGLSGRAARGAPRTPTSPRTPHSLEVEAAAVPLPASLPFAVAHEAGRLGARWQRAERR